ncbi:peroxidasin-like protein [Dendronephthya gigantea]|uniref:peroxidasin-like protein n=1 Tax=Dendronephthya gigantea TaxID=151771 RepID=UPI00106D8B78|nr:peroxidasin-like protein [Dendronephthya gigantea]
MKLVQIILTCWVVIGVQVIGFEFSHDKYAIVLTNNYPRGGIGKITVDDARDGTEYSIDTQYFRIDPDTGHLELLEDGNNLDGLEFEITAEHLSKVATTEVKIFVLPSHYGDQFAFDAINKVHKELGKDKRIPLPPAFVPAALDILLQQIAEGDPVYEISEAEAILEKTIDLVHEIIIEKTEKKEDFEKGAVLAFLQIHELFSRTIITSLEKEANCAIATTPVTCLKKAKYRRLDGKCSNLKLPVSGGAGIQLERLLPAIYYDADGLNDPFGFPNQPDAPLLPSPFEVTDNYIKDEVANSTDPELTPLMMQFGQFMDHDLTLSAEEVGAEKCLAKTCDGSEDNYDAPCYPIQPLGNHPCIKLVRSAAMCQQNDYPKHREQINDVTGVIDGSQIYGSSKATSDDLRDKRSLWIEIEGPRMKKIDTGMRSAVFAIGRDGKTYRLRVDKIWVETEFDLKHVSVGGAGIWGVDKDKNAVRHGKDGFEVIPGIKLQQIDSGPEGVVLGVTLGNDVVCRSGIVPFKVFGTNWKRMSVPKSKYISCGRLGCWGVAFQWFCLPS